MSPPSRSAKSNNRNASLDSKTSSNDNASRSLAISIDASQKSSISSSCRRRVSPINNILQKLRTTTISPSHLNSPDSANVDSVDDSNSMNAVIEIDSNRNVCFEDNENEKLALQALHNLCEQACTITNLQQIVNDITMETASLPDKCGRTALHILSENRMIAESIWGSTLASSTAGSISRAESISLDISQGKSKIVNPQPPNVSCKDSFDSHNHVLLLGEPNTAMMEQLIDTIKHIWNVYPPAMITIDDKGFIPFESVFHQWVNSYLNVTPKCVSSVKDDKPAPLTLFSWMESKHSIASRWLNRSATSYQNHHGTGGSQRSVFSHTDSQKQSEPTSDVEIGSNDVNQSGASVRCKIPQRVCVTSSVISSLTMLSVLLECMDASTWNGETTSTSLFRRSFQNIDRNGSFDLKNYTRREMSAAILHSIASVPDLLKMFLFVEDHEQKTKCLETSLMQKVLLCKYSIGSGRWLVDMFQSHDFVSSELAIHYLQMVSNLSWNETDAKEKKTNYILRTGTLKDRNHEAKEEFYQEISHVQDFVPSLLALSEPQIEEAATTKIVQEVLDRIISRPFAVTVVFCDALFLFVLIFGYRGAVNAQLLGHLPDIVLKYIYITNVGIFYFVIREIGKAVSLRVLSRQVQVYFTFWNIIDFLATLLALVSTILMRCSTSNIRNLCTVTTGFLWLRVLSYLKGLNMQLATFVLAILQIAKDLIWFVVILFVVVVMFSQMFFTLLVPNDCTAADNSSDVPECSQSEYYLKVYAILLGDFGLFKRENFQTMFSVFLAVFFTFATTTILLNVLIAVASDSYEKCLIRSHKLFGRARVLMIAELVSFQNLLTRQGIPDETKNAHQHGLFCGYGRSRGSILFFSLSFFVTVLWTIGEVFGSLTGLSNGNIWMSLGSVLVNVVLLCGIILFLSTGASDGQIGKSEYYSNRYSEWYGRYFQNTMVRLLGSSGGKIFRKGTEPVWQGRLVYLQNEIDKVSMESKNDRTMIMKLIEALIEQSETRVRNELAGVERLIMERDHQSMVLLEVMADFMDKHRNPVRDTTFHP